MIRKIAVILCTLMLLSLMPVAADAPVYPSEFWPLLETYTAALASNDDAAIRDSARSQIALFEGRTDETAINILAYRCYELGNACERLGDYDGARDAFANAIVYLKKFAEFGYNTSVEVAVAENKVQLFTPTFEVYYSTPETQVYYGAINEKEIGVLWGTNCDSGTRSKHPNESMTLIYHNFGVKDSGINAKMLREAAEEGLAVEYALNLPREGAQLAEVLQSKKFIMELIDLFNSVDTPIFLRFGAEMNVWTTPADAQAYIKAFRYVADLVHANTDHVAMVWSPNSLSGWMMDVNAFYPGDEYVDWVGVSLYLLRHFNARNNWTRQEKIALTSYYSGEAAEPVRILEDLIETYGDRKPFMISESGASHTYRTLNGKSVSQTYTEWADEHLTMLYTNLIMAYPQIKAILHFDRVMKTEAADFALSTNKTLAATYEKLTKNGAFVQNSYDSDAKYAWAKLSDTAIVTQGVTEFRSMAFWYAKDGVSVTYLIDGTPVKTVTEMPYSASIDLSKYALGAHTVTVRAEKDGVVLAEKSGTVTVEKALEVKVGGKSLKPVVTGGTVMVPMEGLVSALGGKITTNAKTGVVTIKIGTNKIAIAVGSDEMTISRKVTKLAQTVSTIDGTTYVPLRGIAEAMGAKVTYDEAAKLYTVKK